MMLASVLPSERVFARRATMNDERCEAAKLQEVNEVIEVNGVNDNSLTNSENIRRA